MSRIGIPFFVVLVAGASIFLIVRSKSIADRDERSLSAGAAISRGAAAKSRRSSGTRSPAIPAEEQIRTILAGSLSDAPSFAELEKLTRSLADEELHALIAEIGWMGVQGMNGWVRSGLFAEWGRRDPVAALKSLRFKSVEKGTQHGREQALFAVYRGWSERYPAEAVAQLKKDTLSEDNKGRTTRRSSGHWVGYAYVELFRQFASQDPEGAWEALPDGGPRRGAMAGFFKGITSERQLHDYVDRWVGDWTSAEGIRAHEQYTAQIRSSLGGVIMMPPNETIARSAALALAEFDLEAAEDWLMTAGPGDEQARKQRRSDLLRDWAKNDPDEALGRIGDEGYNVETLARGIIQGDPALAVELMEAIDNHGLRARSLLTAVRSIGNVHVRDFFPVPGGQNRLPNFEERYQQILDAVHAGQFSEGQKESLLRAVHFSFEQHVPAARRAYEG